MTVLTWLGPPVIGAAIGFITNDIAIRMLFRPLKEYRILGIRVPFTPGIIPRRRRELAEAIGRMVSEELITAETVRSYLQEGGARASFQAWVSRATSGLLETELGELGRSERPVVGLAALAEELVEAFFASPHFPTVVSSALEAGLASLQNASVQSLAGGEDVSRAVAQALVRLLPVGSSRGQQWTDEAVDAAAKAVRAAAEPTGRALGQWLSTPEVRPELERRAREFLRTALDKLSIVQKFFVRAAQYDRRLEERLPEIVDDAVRHIGEFLSDSSTQASLSEAVRGSLDRFRQEVEGADGGAPAAAEMTEDARNALVDLAAALMRPLFTQPIGESVGGLLSAPEETLAGRIAERVVQAARRPGAARALGERVRQAAGRTIGQAGLTIGELLGMGPDTKRRLDEALASRALELVEVQLGGMLAGFDVRSMVVRRIEGLDVADVEKLLLIVIARHLKWINVFGALLGALIGTGQVILGLVT
jgi:hypothetical protein